MPTIMTNHPTPSIDNMQDDTIMVQPATRRTIWRKILLVVAIALGLYTMLAVSTVVDDEQIHTFVELIGQTDWSILSWGIALWMLGMIVDIAKYHLVCNTVVGSARLLTSAKVALVGKYYDNVTPFHTGGQPMQMIYLHNKGLPVGDATAVITAKYFANAFAWLAVGVVLLCNVDALSSLEYATRIVLIVASWVGVVAHISMPTLIFLFIVAPSFTKRLLAWIVSLGTKLHFIKDQHATYINFLSAVEQYKASIKSITRYWGKAIVLFCMCLLEPIIVYSMPYILMLALPSGIETSSSMLLTVMAINAFAGFAVMIVPTPGNSGVIEWVTSIAFASMASGVLFWVVFLWRFMMYYIYILLGFALTVHELMRNALRARYSKVINSEGVDIL